MKLELPKKNEIKFSSEEKELLLFGLNMRKNYIEIGDCITSGIDAEKMKLTVKALSEEQIEFINKIIQLKKKVNSL